MSVQQTLQGLDFFRLLRAAEGLTQWRALIASFATFVMAAVIAALGTYLVTRISSGHFIVLALTGIVAFVILASGLSAVGVMLMDRAKSIPVRSLIDAFVYGLMCLPRFIGLGIAILVLLIAVALAAALVYFVCKVPGVGPLLLFVAHPVAVVITAMVFAAIAWVAIPLFAPAVWDGRSFSESLSVLHAVAKDRLVAVVAAFLLLYLVVAIVAGVTFGALIPSYIAMTGVAASILGPEIASIDSLERLFQAIWSGVSGGGGSSGAGGGYVTAAIMATVIIAGGAISLLVQVLVMGVNLVYLITTEGLDVSASQAALGGALAQVKQKAAEAQERARQAAESARQAAERARAQPAPVAAAPAASAAINCPKCNAAVMAADPFCNGCGFKLK